MNDRNNPFSRYAYPNHNNSDLDLYRGAENQKYGYPDQNMQIFSGGDLHAYINDRKVGNLEAVTWTISVEVVGNYVMGRRDAVGYATGKRVIVGSMVFSQYDRHAIIQEVFQLRSRGVNTYADLWQMSPQGTPNPVTVQREINATAESVKGLAATAPASSVNNVQYSFSNMRGLSPQTYFEVLGEQVRNTAALVASTRVMYSDQIPPFDLTLVGVNKNGAASRCHLYGLQITQETGGYSQNDMGNSVGVSYVALGASHWEPLNASDFGAGATLGGGNP